jgi:hypothetical protein
LRGIIRRVRGRAVLIFFVLAAPGAARATRGRLALSLLAGGGYASDVFVGAGLGHDGFFQVTPSGRLDLSLAPRWKLAAAADLSYSRYASSEFSSLSQSGAVEGRWLGGDSWEVSLAGSGEHASYSLGAPLDSALVSSPSVSSTLAGRLSSLLRVRAAGFEWRAAGVAGTRSSTSSTGTVPEDEGAVLAGAMRPISETLSVALTYKLARTVSDRPDFTFTSHALFGLLSWRLRTLELGAQLQLQTATLGTGAREELGRITMSAAYPLAEVVAIEGVYAFTANHTDEQARPSATLHLVFLALRWRFAEATW